MKFTFHWKEQRLIKIHASLNSSDLDLCLISGKTPESFPKTRLGVLQLQVGKSKIYFVASISVFLRMPDIKHRNIEFSIAPALSKYREKRFSATRPCLSMLRFCDHRSQTLFENPSCY